MILCKKYFNYNDLYILDRFRPLIPMLIFGTYSNLLVLINKQRPQIN